MTWGQVAQQSYPGVVIHRQTILEKRVLFAKFSIVLVLAIALIDGQIAILGGEASQPVTGPFTLRVGPATKLQSRLGLI